MGKPNVKLQLNNLLYIDKNYKKPYACVSKKQREEISSNKNFRKFKN